MYFDTYYEYVWYEDHLLYSIIKRIKFIKGETAFI